MDRMPAFEMRRTLRDSIPALPYEHIAGAILGKRYALSLVLCGDTLARRINRISRKKTYAPNVLSFPLTDSEGEIFLNARKAQREARAEGSSWRARLAFLFIHGCLHLKGYKHGARMERLEREYIKRFALTQ